MKRCSLRNLLGGGILALSLTGLISCESGSKYIHDDQTISGKVLKETPEVRSNWENNGDWYKVSIRTHDNKLILFESGADGSEIDNILDSGDTVKLRFNKNRKMMNGNYLLQLDDIIEVNDTKTY